LVNPSDSKVILRRPQVFKHVLKGFAEVFDVDGAASNSLLNYSSSYQTWAYCLVYWSVILLYAILLLTVKCCSHQAGKHAPKTIIAKSQ